jgi:hypothetical protein
VDEHDRLADQEAMLAERREHRLSAAVRVLDALPRRPDGVELGLPGDARRRAFALAGRVVIRALRLVGLGAVGDAHPLLALRRGDLDLGEVVDAADAAGELRGVPNLANGVVVVEAPRLPLGEATGGAGHRADLLLRRRGGGDERPLLPGQAHYACGGWALCRGLPPGGL